MFFTKTLATQNDKQTTELHVIDVGGEPFHSLAVAFIDVLKRAPRVNDATLKTVLERFYAHYPKFKSQLPYLTPSERMGMHIRGPRKSEMVECTAFVLRQLIVDEIYKHPLNYKEVFEGLPPSTPKSYLRDPATPMPISALKALTQSLGITITLSHVEPEKELRKREVFTNSLINTSKLKLVLQVQGNRCFPVVKNKADFVYVGQLAINPPQPVESNEDKTNTIADMIALIADDNKRLLQIYTQWYQNFLTMVDGEELTTKNLFDLYIEFLPDDTNSSGNTTEFFAKLTESEKIPVSTDGIGDPKKKIGDLMAKALAGLLSSGKINLDPFFERLEEYSGHMASPAA